jgi:hypothetical protein
VGGVTDNEPFEEIWILNPRNFFHLFQRWKNKTREWEVAVMSINGWRFLLLLLSKSEIRMEKSENVGCSTTSIWAQCRSLR